MFEFTDDKLHWSGLRLLKSEHEFIQKHPPPIDFILQSLTEILLNRLFFACFPESQHRKVP